MNKPRPLALGSLAGLVLLGVSADSAPQHRNGPAGPDALAREGATHLQFMAVAKR
jgi:hypothetical protein